MHFFKVVGFILVASITGSISQDLNGCTIYGISTEAYKTRAAVQSNANTIAGTPPMTMTSATWGINQQWQICFVNQSFISTISAVQEGTNAGTSPPTGSSPSAPASFLPTQQGVDILQLPTGGIIITAGQQELTWNDTPPGPVLVPIPTETPSTDGAAQTSNRRWLFVKIPQVSRNQTLLLSCVKNLEQSKGTPAYDQYVLEFNQKNKLYETSLSLLTDDGLNYLL